MKIGIIGSGIVAQTLGSGFLRYGHDVTLGTRDANKLKEWAAANPKGRVGSMDEAASFGDVVILAVKGVAAERTVQGVVSRLDGKTVIDTTNPIAETAPVKGVLSYFTGPNESLLERLQKIAAKANVVKAFSSVGSPHMINPTFPGSRPTMFICGNHDGAKRTVVGFLDQFGWDAADMGSAEAARAIEPLAMLWCIPGLARNEWNHAFKLLKR